LCFVLVWGERGGGLDCVRVNENLE
jgi:hypothetical protein